MSQGDETARTREALKAGVAASVHDLIDRADTLTEETRLERIETRRSRRWTQALTLVAFVACLVSVVGTAGVGYELGRLNGIADTNKANGVAIRSTLDAIQACTTPGHACSDRNAQGTAAALELLARADCAGDFPKDLPRQRLCVVAALKVLTTPPKKAP